MKSMHSEWHRFISPNCPTKTTSNRHTPASKSNITHTSASLLLHSPSTPVTPKWPRKKKRPYIEHDHISSHQSRLYSFSIQILDMDKKREPDPRFQQFIEALSEDGKVIGFTLPDNPFLFKYDTNGGWLDEKGNYFNSEGILQSEDEESEDEDSLDERDQDIVDEFEDLLRQEEEGVVSKVVPPKEQKKVEVAVQKPQKKGDLDFSILLEKYKNKELVRQNLPGELFIYFKQDSQQFQKITAAVEKKQSVDDKNKEIEVIIKNTQEKRNQLLKEHEWLNEPGVFLDFSGESDVESQYERYWYGHIKTVPERYLPLLEKITKDNHFYLLSYKTFFALKSKFYLKKAEEVVKKHIKELTDKIEKISDEQAVVLRFDNLPENYPLSFVYDLVEYVGGKLEDIEEAHIVDRACAEILVLKDTALKIANLEAYNHDKGEYLELSISEIKKRVTTPGKFRFFWIQVEGEYKLHERELYDTLGLRISKEGLAKHLTEQEYKKSKVRFGLGSIDSLKKVLLFRGPSLNTIHVWASPQGSK